MTLTNAIISRHCVPTDAARRGDAKFVDVEFLSFHFQFRMRRKFDPVALAQMIFATIGLTPDELFRIRKTKLG